MTLRRILICTGGSPYAERAARLGESIAAGVGAAVTLLAVEDPHEAVDLAGALDRAGRVLSELGVTHETKVRKGHPAQEILKESTGGYDLVVLGSHGTRGILDFLLGDTATQVVEHRKISTLVVRGTGEVHRVLVSLRLGREKPDLMRTAGELARVTRSALTLLYVVPAATLYPFGTVEPAKVLLRYPVEGAYLERLAGEMERAYGVRSEIRIREGVPEEEILEEGKTGGHDLLIIGSSAWRGLPGMLLGNFSYTIVKHAAISVLVVMPR